MLSEDFKKRLSLCEHCKEISFVTKYILHYVTNLNTMD